MPNVLVVRTQQAVSGVPADAVVNTFSFSMVEDFEEPLIGDLQDFYNLAPDGQTNPLGYYLSGWLSRAAGAVTYEIYDRADPAPRVPIYSTTATPPPSGSGDNLPNEVAACISFRGEYLSGQPRARARGRIFLGPLRQNALLASSSIAPQLHPTFMAVAAKASERLSQASGGNVWQVWSSAAGSGTPVVAGWINSDPDTQRRRQAAATSRVAWSSLV